VTGTALLFAFLVNSKKKTSGVPTGIQNIAEAVVEFLINMIEPALGTKLVPIALPFLGTFFLYIFFSNVLLIVPHPFGNPPTGDISVTAALAFVCVFGIHFYNIFIVNGPKKAFQMWFSVPGMSSDHDHQEGHAEEINERKSFSQILFGFFKGLPMLVMILVFFVLKLVDNGARLLSLSLRLFGNIYGEHTILSQTTEIAMNNPKLVITLCIPFLILCFDVMVALIQSVVFTNLSLFYIKEEWGVHD
ncbi:MAG: F0F1 ATP synthase subunit A, partial [bacterium]